MPSGHGLRAVLGLTPNLPAPAPPHLPMHQRTPPPHPTLRQLILNSWRTGRQRLCAHSLVKGRTHMFSLQSGGAGGGEKESWLNCGGNRQMGGGGHPVPAASTALGQRSEVSCSQRKSWEKDEHETRPHPTLGERPGVPGGCRLG